MCYLVNMETLVQACIATLTKATGLDVEFHERTPAEYRAPHDGLLIIRTAAGSDRYAVEVKRSVTTNNLPAVLSQLHRMGETHHEPPLLMSAYVPPAVATQLESHGVAYADAVGNAHLNGPAAYVHILGKRPQPAASITGLTATDLTIVFAILCRPRLLQEPLRTIATETGISLGKVSSTLRSLDALEFIHTEGRHRMLRQPERLLNRWELGYLETVRPRLHPTTWGIPPETSLEATHQQALRMQDVLIGGEYAADALTRFLKPGSLTLHLPSAATKRAAVELRLRPSQAEAPSVMLVDRFLQGLDQAEPPSTSGTHTPKAHPILARAELLAIGSDRLREVADRIRDDHILPRLRDAV